MSTTIKLDKSSTSAYGAVSLVGAGPGDADLLTVKALKSIQSADIIVYDNLVSADIRALFPSSALALYVGKAKGQHYLTQDEINNLLIDRAQQGYSICRLKGGDPFVFGRGGEEMLALKQAGIEVEIVPGITAGIGAAAYSGIPVTHRGISQGCTFVTAHGEKSLDLDWAALAHLDHTLVFYMGLSKLPMITGQLTQNGLSPDTPAALIERGCQQSQRTFTTTLAKLSDTALENKLQSPSLVVVGHVVSLAEPMHWFGTTFNNSTSSAFEFEASADMQLSA
ncbi:uroporphyrinogen-III C-methyltransferase [Saccharobesus litoralis]|uniref:uroporphyrinogen-III C-methyltransferase n=1 Tax=Saccharobesus litoralis TaxID=2172099 RepID=A0A2S0VVT2_9ALTE|nr:uroporphyrinogen-III C-methyltransferase [Saccharobesus litoralis]AWB68326.1 uroporphyrinogen-III C-methyltransferase [Saccharobesus litoralis]